MSLDYGAQFLMILTVVQRSIELAHKIDTVSPSRPISLAFVGLQLDGMLLDVFCLGNRRTALPKIDPAPWEWEWAIARLQDIVGRNLRAGRGLFGQK